MATREEIKNLHGRAKQMAMVTSPDAWPHRVLPMVRRDRSSTDMAMANCGLIFRDKGPVVYPGNLITGVSGDKPIQYPDWDGLLDVWEVD